MATFAPARHDLEALLARRQGDLRDEPYRLLLLAIATQGKNGVLTLTRGPLEKDVIFDSGAAIDCQSNIATESLGRFLVSSGRISEEQSPEALPAAELNRAIQQSLGRKLLEPFSWTSGTWEFSADAPPVEAAHRVRVPQLIVTGIVKVEPFETIEAALEDAGAMRLTIGDASELRLTEEQQRTLAALREGATLEQFAGNEDLQRFIYALLLLGIARPASEPAVPFFELDIPPEQPRSAGFPSTALRAGQPAAPPASSRPESTPQFAPSADVLSAHADYRQKDAFDLLGLDTTAGAVEINRAFVRAAERFLPSRYEEQVRDKAQELLLASARAYSELADPMRRQALIDRRAGKPTIAAPAPAAPSPPPPPRPAPTSSQRRRAIIDPEELYREGRAAAAAGKLRDALGYFEMAADCDAQNGTYAAEVAYARYQLLISPATAAVKALKNAIRIDPRCGIAYLYLGRIQEALGNKVEAQAYLGRASTLGAR